MTYSISEAALNDLENIWLYTFENWSVEQADRYYNLLMNEIEYLTVQPKSGKDFSHVRKGYYRTRVKSHFIFYKINRKDDVIRVIRILHQRMDIESGLGL